MSGCHVVEEHLRNGCHLDQTEGSTREAKKLLQTIDVGKDSEEDGARSLAFWFVDWLNREEGC